MGAMDRISNFFAGVFGLALASGVFHGSCFAQDQGLASTLVGLRSVKAEQVFDGAALAGQEISSYRLVTALSPDRLLADVEAIWSRIEYAKVWRSTSGPWTILSKVEKFPAIEVLQAKRGANGETVARLSFGAPGSFFASRDSSDMRFANTHSGGASTASASESLLLQWLPNQAKVLQTFSSRDPGKQGVLMIARAFGHPKAGMNWIEQQAKRSGFSRDARFINLSNPAQSQIALLVRGDEEVIATLDRMDSEVAIVFQHSKVGK
jgi:hypothetical protein